MINKLILLALIHMFLALVCSSVATGSEASGKLYPLPMSELKTVVSDWLLESGFEVRLVSPERGRVDISILRGQESWQLTLLAHSPLATRVRIETKSGDRAELLWEHIDAYLRGLFSQALVDSSQVAIPSPVMTKVEAVVCIKTSAAHQNLQFSGFAISGEGVILCTAHDLKSLSRVTVILHDGRKIEGQVVKLDAFRDLAMVFVKARFKHFVDLRTGQNRLGMNERLFSVGCPMNVQGVIQSGTLHGEPRRVNGLPLWQVDLAMQPGGSGSPVFNAAGELVGMIKGRYRGTESLGFFIPLETLVQFVKGNGTP